jgi:transcriptional regulator with XRE-family HTH domain
MSEGTRLLAEHFRVSGKGAQAELAAKVRVDQGWLSRLAADANRKPDLRLSLLLEEHLGIPIKAWLTSDKKSNSARLPRKQS